MDPVQWSSNGHWYTLNETRLSWDDAKAAAEAMSYQGSEGHLVTLTSAEENAWLFETFGDQLSNPFHWIGAHQADPTLTEDGWSWVTDEPWGYENWAPQEPNDYFATNPPFFSYEDVVHFYPRNGSTWADTVRSVTFPSVVEFDGVIGNLDKAIGNIVLYLNCDTEHGADTKIKIDEWNALEGEIRWLNFDDVLEFLGGKGYGDCELEAITVKAGNNGDKSLFHPGDGALVYGDYDDIGADIAHASPDVTYYAVDVYEDYFIA